MIVMVTYTDEGVLDHDSREEYYSVEALGRNLRDTADQEYTDKVLDWAEDGTNDSELTLANGNSFDVWSKEA